MNHLDIVEFINDNKACNMLEFVTNNLINDDSFMQILDNTLCQNNKLCGLSKDQKIEQIKMLMFNTCRGYILKTLVVKYIYEKLLQSSNYFLDYYWQEKLDDYIKN